MELPQHLRPIESRILAMTSDGLGSDEIGRRFGKSPAFVERVIEWTQIPRTATRISDGLRPIERRVLALRANGESHQLIGERFRRSERSIRQIEGLAHYRKGLRILSESAAELRG